MSKLKANKIVIIFMSCALIAATGLTLGKGLGGKENGQAVLKSESVKVKRVFHADYESYPSLEKAYDSSLVLIKGKVLDSEEKEVVVSKDGQYKYNYVVSKVKVSKVLKGNEVEDSIIFVKQLADSQTMDVEGISKKDYLEKSGEYYLFMRSFGVESSVMPYSLINPHQGKLKVSYGNIIATDKYMTVSDNEVTKKRLDGMKLADFEEEMSKIKLRKK